MTPHTYTTPPKVDESKYGVVSWPRYLWMNAKAAFVLVVITKEVLLSPFVARSQSKSLRRVIGDTIFRYVTDNLTEPELQCFLGTSVGVYSGWARKAKLPVIIDELGDGGKLLWIGPKRTDKMLLYCHGGAYIAPIQDFTLPFWRYIQLELEKQGIQIGIAIMCYSLVPVGQFPAPLWQASRAIQHLISVEKVKPSNLQLVGDSAGGNLIAQILSSMLHPLFSPPIIPPGIRLRGAYMMSPWVSLTGVGSRPEEGLAPSLKENDHSDVIGAKGLHRWGSLVLSGIENLASTDVLYAEPIRAPFDWYKGLPDIVERVLISTGGAECLRDQGRMFFDDKIKPWHDQAEHFEIAGGVHNDPYFDFQVANGPLGARQTLTPKILDWLKKGFEK